ncbi:MAG: lipid kinase YegS [Planctomycetia bacterium]|nr:lipid kinase YegS [Planctomycetia bacterium]
MRIRLILNGKKADRSDVRDAVRAVRAEGHPVEVRVTWEHGDAQRLVAEAARDGIERVIAGGGDGSVNEIANGLMAVEAVRRPVMGILPLGTANDFATACRVPGDALAALRLAATGEPGPVDLGRCNDAFFANIACGGFGAAVTAETPVELKNFLGGGAYTIMGLVKAVNFRPYACSITTPAGVMQGSVIVGAICNGRQAGGGQLLAPEAYIDDGLLDLVFLRPFPVNAAPLVAAEIASRNEHGDYVVRMRVPWVEVAAPDAIPLNLDGEPTSGTRFRFSADPNCVRMVLPPACPCLRGG